MEVRKLPLELAASLFRSALSPWAAETGEGLEPHLPPSKPTRPPLGATRVKVVVNSRPIPNTARSAVAEGRGGGESGTDFLPVLPSAPSSSSPRHQPSRDNGGGGGRLRNASPLMSAYHALVEQSEAMTTSFADNCEQRRLHEAALRMGIAQLSGDRVREQQRAIRFNTLKNEVDIFQQYLDPFIFEMRSAHEHQVTSSVYRHFTRMQNVQEMGIPIYSLGNYLEDEYDRILTARTRQKFYRRIRRHDAAHYIDTELIPRPSPPPARRRAVAREAESASTSTSTSS